MTDRILNEEEVDGFKKVVDRNWLLSLDASRRLIASHRLLQQRVTELEGQAEVCSGPCHSPGYKRDD